MSFTPEQIEMLKAKLDGSVVKPPPQGKYGSYIEGWHAIAEANRIFGFDGWSYRVDSLTPTNSGIAETGKGKMHVTGYMALVTVEAGDASRQDVGHGQGFSKNEGDSHDSAIKEAVTDALKRALKSFGNQFGLALYDKSGENVERSNGSTGPSPKPRAETVTNPAFVQQQAEDFLRLISATETVGELQDLWTEIGPKVAKLSGAWRDTVTAAKDNRKGELG